MWLGSSGNLYLAKRKPQTVEMSEEAGGEEGYYKCEVVDC